MKVSTLVLILLLHWGTLSSSQTYLLPNSMQEGAIQLEIARNGSVYAAFGVTLTKFDRDLHPAMNVSLPSAVVKMTLSGNEEYLVVCMKDFSCVVFHTRDLLARPQRTIANVTNNKAIALFSYSGSDFVVGSSSGQDNFTLSRVDGSGQSVYSPAAKVYYVANTEFQNRTFLYGFSIGECSYFIVYDCVDSRGILYEVRVVKSCHNDTCCSGSSSCSFTSITEDLLNYGTFGPKNVCKISLVENYGGSTNGYSILLTLCGNPSTGSHNMISSFSLTMLDINMNRFIESCSRGESSCASTIWSSEQKCREVSYVTPCNLCMHYS